MNIDNVTKNILLVEDEAIISIITLKALTRFGYNVITANSGEKAVEIAAADNEINLILMDINLGEGIDGTEAARQILVLRNIPIVFHTSHSEREMVEKVRGITRYGYVVKSSGDFVLQSSIEMAFELFDANHIVEQSMNAMKESEEKYRAAFMTSPDAVNINAMDGCYVDINEGFTKLTGFSRDDVIGVRSTDINIWSKPEDRIKLINGLKETGVVENLESLFRCKDGSFKTALMSARIIKLKNEPHILSITRDITERKYFDDEIKVKNEELTALNEELSATIEEMEASIEAMETINEDLIIKNEQLIESEQQVEMSEEKFRQMFFQHSAVMLLIDPDSGHIIDANSAAELYYGYDISKFRNMRIQDINILSPEGVSAEMQLAKDHKRNYFIFPHRLANLEIRTVEVHSSPVTINGNNLLFSIVHDITERTRVDEKLLINNERYTMALVAIDDGIWEWSVPDGKAFFSASYFNILGYSNEEFAASYDSWRLLVHPEDIDRVEIELKNSIASGRKFNIELRMKTKSCEWLWVCVRGKAVERNTEGSVIKMVGTLSEISERKNVEQALVLSEERLRKAQAVAHVGHWTWDLKTSRVEWSDEMYRIFAIDKNNYTGRLGDVITLVIHPDDLHIVLPSNASAFASGKPVEYRIVWPDGTIRHILAETGDAIPDSDGKPAFLTGTCQDITEHKRSDEKIKNLLTEKELILKEVHHRIKNNMNTINSLFLMQADASENSLVASALADAGCRVQSMMVLYDRLYGSSDFSNLSVKEYFFPLIDEIVSNFPNSSIVKIEKNIEEFKLDVKILSSLGIIVNELLTNIMKYAFTGKADGLITVSVLLKDNTVSVTVQDNGEGLPESVDFEKSTGFGMQLVRILAEQIGGRIRVERGEGARFIIEFALRQAQ